MGSTMDSAERRTPRPVGAVIDLAHVDSGMMPAVGGKSANLGVLLAAGSEFVKVNEASVSLGG